MCSRQDDKHTNEQGWTTIEANKRKPKSKTSTFRAVSNLEAISPGSSTSVACFDWGNLVCLSTAIRDGWVKGQEVYC
jgi:hypothetical protein